MTGLLRKLFWLLLFVSATFCWYVLFEHGFSAEAFIDGAREEWASLVQWLRRNGD
jgi:hypothetical protein